MGHLKYFDLTQYNADILIETGTGIGNGLFDSLSYNFEQYYSCEIEESLYDKNVERFKAYPNVHLFKTNSLEYLETILPAIPKEKNIVFWLDAHFPGADYVTGIYSTKDDGIDLPLVAEMEIIDKYRLGCKDVILIDDMCLLKPFGNHQARLEQCHQIFINYPGIEFLQRRQANYTIKLHEVAEGYIEVTPK